MPEVNVSESLVSGLAVWDALTGLVRGQAMERVRAAGLEQFLPDWFDSASERINVAAFFYEVGLNRGRDYLDHDSLQNYLQSVPEGRYTLADVVTRIREEQPHHKESELLGVNTLTVLEAGKLCGKWMPTPQTYLLALSRVARNVGPEVFERIYDNSVLAQSSSDFQAYRRIRNAQMISFCHDLISVAPQWEGEVTRNEDGSLPESEMIKTLSHQDRFVDPHLLEKVNVFYRHGLLV